MFQNLKIFVALVALALSTQATAQKKSDAEIAKELANPLSDLISIPFQLNYDSGFGNADGHRTTLNIQPVISFSLNPEYNVLSRTVLPVIDQADIFGQSGSQFGLGDTVQSFFIAPNRSPSEGWLIGAGTAFLLPTATDALLGSGKWGAGPTAVAVRQIGPWTFAGLTNHIWSLAGDEDRPDVSLTLLQPSISYTTESAWQYTFSTESTYNWETEDWSVPLNLNVGKTVRFGKLPVKLGGGVRYWATSPDTDADGWGVRLFATFVLPKSLLGDKH